jgi:hypothetical protein
MSLGAHAEHGVQRVAHCLGFPTPPVATLSAILDHARHEFRDRNVFWAVIDCWPKLFRDFGVHEVAAASAAETAA